MKLHFYGSSASEGVPSLFCECEYCEKFRKLRGKNLRTRTATQIDEDLLIDCSIDLYAQTLFRHLDIKKINTILITHSHEDHFLPVSLCHVKPPMAKYHRDRQLNLYANQKVTSIMTAPRSTEHNAPLEKYLKLHTVSSFDIFQAGEYTITALPANHDKKEDCFIFIIKKNGKTLLYGHDSGVFDESVWKALQGHHFDCVVLDCTTVEKTGIYPTHMGLPDNIIIRNRMLHEKLAEENTLFIATHFAHTFDPDHNRITPIFSEKGFIAAYDGLSVEF